jgi:hypothetical protein
MSLNAADNATFLRVAPRFGVSDMERALVFCGQLGFQTSSYDEDFGFAERDGVTLHLQSFSEPSEGHAVCWIEVTNSEALYQQYLAIGAVCSPLSERPWGFKEFCIRDPFGNLMLFAERLPWADAAAEQE